jgi:REP element-mobilizing transposase RayT
MSRPLRIEFSGALYHVTARGNRRESIFLDDGDQARFLDVLGEVCRRFNWQLHAYCLMTNHYHLLIETPEGNLSKGMRQLNGVYTQRFNRTHGRVGHVFQGRFKGILVQKESYLLELARYIVLNPVRAGMVPFAQDWPWSSYLATVGLVDKPDWLATDWLLSAFSAARPKAIERYTAFVAQGAGQAGPWEQLRGQIYLGSDEFVQEMQRRMSPDMRLSEVPGVQKRQPAKPLSLYQETFADRDTAIYHAYLSGGYSLKQIGEHFGLHYSRVSRIVNQRAGAKSKT